MRMPPRMETIILIKVNNSTPFGLQNLLFAQEFNYNNNYI